MLNCTLIGDSPQSPTLFYFLCFWPQRVFKIFFFLPLSSRHRFEATRKWRSCRKCLPQKLKACGWCGQQLLLLFLTKQKGSERSLQNGDSTSLLFLLRCFYNTAVTSKELCSGPVSSPFFFSSANLCLLHCVLSLVCARWSLINKVFFCYSLFVCILQINWTISEAVQPINSHRLQLKSQEIYFKHFYC